MQEQKAWFLLLQVIIKNIKPQTHGKSQRSEIFVNKAAEPRQKRAMPAGHCEKLASGVAVKSAEAIEKLANEREAEGYTLVGVLSTPNCGAILVFREPEPQK